MVPLAEGDVDAIDDAVDALGDEAPGSAEGDERYSRALVLAVIFVYFAFAPDPAKQANEIGEWLASPEALITIVFALLYNRKRQGP